MSRKPITIIMLSSLLLIGAVAFSFWKTGIKNQSAEAAAVSTNGLTLDLRFGNNNAAAAPTVYDSSGFNRHATSTAGATSPTCNGNFCNFDGGDYMTANATNVFNSASQSIAIKFSPDFAANDGAHHFFLDTPAGTRNYIYKATAGMIYFALTDTAILLPLASYSPYWKVGRENILVFTVSSGNNNIWLNGYKVLNADSTAWSASNPTTMVIGSQVTRDSFFFDGKLHYLKVWNRLLTDAEVGVLSADRTAKTASAPMASSTPTGGGKLVGHWTMDTNDISGTTMYDKSGQNKRALLYATPTQSTGKINQALTFNGSTQYTTASSTIASGGTFTATGWAKWSSNATSQRIFCVNGIISGAGGGGICVAIKDATSGLLILYEAVAWGSGTNLIYADNKWHFLALVRSGTTSNLYVDGSSASISSITNTAIESTENYIGANYYSGVGSFFPGSIDDVRIYNYALSAQEVTQLYTSAKKNYTSSAPMDGLVGHWTMDANDINGTSYFDKSGFNNTATSTGSPTVTAGKIGQATNLNGTSAFIGIPCTGASNQAGNLTFNDTDNFTLAIWYKGTDTEENGDGGKGLIGRNNNDTYAGFVLRSGYAEYIHVPAGAWLHNIKSNTMVADNRWRHIVYVNNSNETGNLYVDGIAEITGQSSSINNTYRFKACDIGRNLIAKFLNGSIDDVRIYNRALSPSEVSQLYQSAKKSYVR